MKTGIFGGAFNPPHLGHLRLAQASAEALGLDRLIVVPTGVSPHKQSGGQTTAPQRLEMCRRQFGELPDVTISDYELDKKGPSYTVKTIEYFKKLYPGDELFLIIGSDMFLTLPQWYEFEKIINLCVIAVAARTDEDIKLIKKFDISLKKQYALDTVIIDVQPFEASSTQARSGDFTKLDPKIERYIRDFNLYL